MNNKKRFMTALMTTAFSMTQFAYAQTVQSDGDASIVTYEKVYFANYNAVTLLDMLQIIPGVNDILNRNQNQGGGGASGQGSRGFGSGGDQILINGKRLAGKSNSVDDTLGRISADQVRKIELIRGTTGWLRCSKSGD
jgi:outer membrane receptor for ferrienterochelin and colicin